MGNIKEKSIDSNYRLIDLLKFICAFLVVGIHTRPFQASSDLLDKLFYYDISNYAVPFFYACTGYFLIVKSSEENLHVKLMLRCKKILRIYLTWSAIYLPLTISGWIVEGGLNPTYLILCLRNFVFVGDNFYSWTLWYLNGLIFALLLIDILLRKFSVKQIANIGAFVYLIGIGLTMLNGHLESLPLFLQRPVNLYFSLFVTTRNGLFQSLVFVTFGMLIAERDRADELKLSVKNGLFAGIIYIVKVGFSLIGGGQYFTKILDLPTFWFLFGLIIYACKRVNLKGMFYKQLRGMSETIYFVHMYFVALCSLVLYKGNYHNFKSYFICAGGATIIALLCQIYKNKKRGNNNV